MPSSCPRLYCGCGCGNGDDSPQPICMTDRRKVPMTTFRVGERGLAPALLRPFNSQRKAAFAGTLAVLCCLSLKLSSASAGPVFGELRGVTRSAQGAPIPAAQVLVHSVEDNTDLKIVSNGQGEFVAENLRP